MMPEAEGKQSTSMMPRPLKLVPAALCLTLVAGAGPWAGCGDGSGVAGADSDSDTDADTDTDTTDYPDGTETPTRLCEIEYVIITPQSMAEAFQPLAEWKTRKGVPTVLKTTEKIYEQYSGVDQAEQVREFLKELAAVQPKLQWVLLGGDTPHVPHREFWSEADVFGYYHTSGVLASDLYFADLDGTWDGDGDGTWGEPEDGLDLIPELYVGRAPVDDADEAAGFVAKVLAYEQAPPEDFVNTALFVSEPTGYGIPAAMGIDPMASEIFPERFEIRKLYDEWEGYANAEENTYDAQLEAFDTGFNLYAHFGHGGGSDVSYLDMSDIHALDNGPRNGVFVTTACFSGAFHTEEQSGGEGFVANPDGGGIAYIGNTEIGLGFPSGMDYILQFYKELFSHRYPVVRLGELFSRARVDFTTDRDRHEAQGPDRWCTLELVLFGEPEMQIWRDEPARLEVEHPQRLVPGKNRLIVTVRRNGRALEGASVTLSHPEVMLHTVITDAQGRAELRVAPTEVGEAWLGVTGFQVVPYVVPLVIEEI